MAAATVFLSESNGVGEVVTDNIANLNFGAFDGPNMIPTQHPINVGQNSVGKWIRVKLQAKNGITQIANMGIWKSSGAYLTGETLGSQSNATVYYPDWSFVAGYAHRTNNSGGTPFTVPYSGSGSDIYGGNSSAALGFRTSFVNNVFAPGNTVLNVDGTYSLYVLIQLCTSASTPQGSVNQKVISFQWTES